MGLLPHCGQAYSWSSLPDRPASTITESRTPLFTSLRERLVFAGATSENIRPLWQPAIFYMCRVGCHIRNSTLLRTTHFDGWWCEVPQNRSLSICLATSGLPHKYRGE